MITTPPTKAELNRCAVVKSTKADCANCPFAIEGKPNKPVLGVGGVGSRGVIITEYPSKEDVEAGEAITGLLGQQFDYTLASVGLPREHLFIVPAIACRPVVEKTDVMMRVAATACRPLLLSQLSRFNKNIPILSLGKVSYYALYGKDKSVYMGRGFIRQYEIPGGK